MKSLSNVSFLLLGTVFFHLFSSTAVEAASKGKLLHGEDKGAKDEDKRYCVPKPEASDAALQKNLDWACGQGIDCSPIQPGGICGDPATVRFRAQFAMNSYYRKEGGIDSACDFSGTAQITHVDPSSEKCKYV
ncbi:hypothetical protein ERO13_D10G228700v2 [Gossypium hirsutum]|uniref:Major pollen allergen Ole e 10 n=4 Tax=Gossypium TaxID=3633 RepID=A0A1U8M6B6_GOSHI|nr:major pollen allergen Ole e 10-like [Gossypium hirsutum]KAB2010709.1 hypothetical protein ES319_D10G260200v1 [Gossypium barbadense]TYG51713.1 hypothetical protein ES288_D10G282000v1 [Gossypium darwinii]TYH51550.1 hypothetical protein ES332_D10G283800v1 [Gossypium tomentosum]KAG4127655.1 hypothetical protein ERO13_D10G228700v2 [Gossypium hirsutum]PPD78484.1 hypothetical protein GOBAR_DD24587 [Gossypium barbadense]